MSAMVLAWCFFFAGKWEVKRLAPFMDPNSMTSAAIFAFDLLEDLESTGREVDRALVSIIVALGTLVGFSWEQSFEGAATQLASLTANAARGKLGLAFVVALIVVPAWHKYILKTTLEIEARYLQNPEKSRSKQFDTGLADELSITESVH